jgi:hypothetical protein
LVAWSRPANVRAAETFAEFVKAESEKWKKVVTDANLKAE